MLLGQWWSMCLRVGENEIVECEWCGDCGEGFGSYCARCWYYEWPEEMKKEK